MCHKSDFYHPFLDKQKAKDKCVVQRSSILIVLPTLRMYLNIFSAFVFLNLVLKFKCPIFITFF